MILRVVNGWIPPDALDVVVEADRRDYAPIARRTAGLDRYVVAVRLGPDGGNELAA